MALQDYSLIFFGTRDHQERKETIQRKEVIAPLFDSTQRYPAYRFRR